MTGTKRSVGAAVPVFGLAALVALGALLAPAPASALPHCAVRIGDFVWNDANHNGVQDPGEPGIDGVVVQLFDAVSGTPLGSTTTALGDNNQHGYYLFTLARECGLQTSYRVSIPNPPPGWVPTITEAGSDNTRDSNPNNDVVVFPPSPEPETLSDLTIDFGFQKVCAGTIGDFVWDDLDRDGVQDANEPGIDGLVVTLRLGGVAMGTYTTGVGPGGIHGYYQFTGVCGGTYTVDVPAPAGYTPSPSFQGDPATDSNGSPATVTLPDDNASDQTIDFGFQAACTGTIGNFVWHDLDHDGIQDPGEPGIDGRRVVLLRGSTGWETWTASGGAYEFTGLCGGDYRVETSVPPGFSPSPTTQGDNREVDSNGIPEGDPPSTVYSLVTLPTNNSHDPTIDFGFQTPCTGTLGDFVWEDLNANGVQDASEPGINGVTVNLRRASDYSLIRTTTTTIGGQVPHSGYYQFTGVCAGDYRVEMVSPAGYVKSPTEQGPPETDSNVTPFSVTLPSDNGSDQTIDFGLYRPASVGNFVWHDLNGNGRQDEGEPPIAGATVRLTDCSGGPVLDISFVPVSPQITVADGFYQFVNLKPGQYQVTVALPGGFVFTVPFASDQATDSNITPATGRSDCRTLVSGQYDDSVDAGGYIPTAIGDLVWQDLNANGRQDGGEMGLAGSTVTLWRCGPDGQAGTPDDVPAGAPPQVTAGNGAYWFGNLAPGCYFVTFTTPMGYVPTVANAADDAADSDAAGGMTGPYTLVSGVPNPTVDAGFYVPGTCNVSLNKTCEVPLAVTSPFTCSDAKPISEMTVKWSGTATVWIKAWNGSVGTGTPQMFNAVMAGQEVTFTRSGTFPNDVYFEIFSDAGMANKLGTSTFHLSCSDVDMNGPEDCGKAAGDGKLTGSSYINTFIFDGMAGNGQRLECTPPASLGQEACTTTWANPSCAALGKPLSLTFRLTNNTCDMSSNRQPSDKWACSGIAGSPAAVSIIKDPNRITVDKATIAVGELLTISARATDMGADIQLQIGGQMVKFHSSCSQPLAVGDSFGSLELVAFNGQEAGVDVLYRFIAQNNGSNAMISISDDPLGPIVANHLLPSGTQAVFERSARLTQTTTNRATLTASVVGALSCSATDSTTVTLQRADCILSGGDATTKDKQFKWPITNGGSLKSTVSDLTLTWPAAGGRLSKVKFDGDVLWDGLAGTCDATTCSLALVSAQLTSDTKRKSIDPGRTRILVLEFERNAGTDLAAYALTLGFGNACSLEYEPPTTPPIQLAVCSDLKPIEQVVLQYAGSKAIGSVSWYRTTVSDLNNPGTTNLIGTATGAQIGSTPFSFGNFAANGSTNDVDFVITFTDGTKQRSRFHLSCSDADMNDITDCGKLQGDGKANDVAGGNLWTLRDLQGKGLQMCSFP